MGSAGYGCQFKQRTLLSAAQNPPSGEGGFPRQLTYFLSRAVRPVSSEWQVDNASIVFDAAGNAGDIGFFDQTFLKLTCKA